MRKRIVKILNNIDKNKYKILSYFKMYKFNIYNIKLVQSF